MSRSFVAIKRGKTARLFPRILLLCAMAVIAFAALPLPAVAQNAETARSYEIPAGPLDDRLAQFSREAGITLSYDPALVEGETAPALEGSYTTEAALTRLLARTDLIFRAAGAGVVTIARRDTDDRAGPRMLPPLVVTARRTEELLQDVPGSVAVVTSGDIEESNLRTGEDLYGTLPNVNFFDSSTPNFRELSIRGASNLVGFPGGAPVVGLFIDGVLANPTGYNGGTNPNLRDLERVEVAYGSQTTAFGRGTTGGAINFVTAKPTDAFEGSLELEGGSYPSGDATAVLNVPILEEGLLSARIVGFGSITDGFVDLPNVPDQDKVGSDELGGRISLRSQPTDRLTLDGSLSFDRQRFDGGNIATPESFDNGDLESPVNFIGEFEIERTIAQLAFEFDTGLGFLKSRTGYQRIEDETLSDRDVSQFDFFIDEASLTQDSFSQEIRFESDRLPVITEGPEVSVNLGASYGRSELDAEGVQDPQQGIIDLVLGVPDDGSTIVNLAGQETESVSVFGDLRLYPTADLEIVLGGRYSWDEVSASSEIITSGLLAGVVPPQPLDEPSGSFQGFAPSASIKYDWSENVSTYFTFASGYRPGGFQTGLFRDDEFGEETNRSFEIGVKSRWFQDRLHVSASAFYTDFTDLQVFGVQIVNNLEVIQADNAPGARSIGGELFVEAQPVPGLRLSGGLGVTKAEFTDFPNSQFGDLEGVTLPNAPDLTATFTAEYEHQKPLLLDYLGFVRGEFNYTGGYRGQLDPAEREVGDYSVVNLRAGVRGEHLDIFAYVENVFNEIYATGEQPNTFAGFTGFQNLDVGPTRQFGLGARIRF